MIRERGLASERTTDDDDDADEGMRPSTGRRSPGKQAGRQAGMKRLNAEEQRETIARPRLRDHILPYGERNIFLYYGYTTNTFTNSQRGLRSKQHTVEPNGVEKAMRWAPFEDMM